MKTKRILLLACGLFMALSFTGCQLDDSGITGFLYEEKGGSYIVTDQFQNELTFTRDQAAQIAELGEETAAAFLTARFRSSFPDSYADPATETSVANAVDVPGQVSPSKAAETITNSLAFIPGYGQLASVLANGALAIGALWYRSRKKKGDLVAESLFKGIDTFRDVLDQTDQGELIDRELTARLKEHRDKLGVAKEVLNFMDRWTTADKPKGGLSLN